ncbi:choice-of-anchor M domain-containing protein [Nocardiopsis sp. ARC36]
MLSEGHVDLRPVIEGGLEIYAGYDDPVAGEKVYHDADEVVLHAKPESQGSVPESDAFAFLGDPGADLWMLPQVQQADLLWPGWSTEDIRADRLDPARGVDWTLTGYDGPGTFSLFQNGAFGTPQVVFHTGDGVPDTLAAIPAGTHAHGNWAFTAEGHYWLDLTFTAAMADGRELEGETTLIVAVGDVDPADVPDRNGGDTPDPTADPTDPSSPAPRPTDGGGTPPAGGGEGGSAGPVSLPKTGALLVPLVIAGAVTALTGAALLTVRGRATSPTAKD